MFRTTRRPRIRQSDGPPRGPRPEPTNITTTIATSPAATGTENASSDSGQNSVSTLSTATTSLEVPVSSETSYTLAMSTIYLDFNLTWVTNGVGILTFPPTPAANQTGIGDLAFATTGVDGLSITTQLSRTSMAYSEARASMASYSTVSTAAFMTSPTMVPTQQTSPPGQDHSTRSVVGAAVGSFFGGVILATAFLTGFLILRKRSQRRQRRDRQIHGSFDRRPSIAAGQTFEDIALSSEKESKPLTSVQSDGKSISDQSTAIEIPEHLVKHMAQSSRSIDASSVRSAYYTAGKQESIAEKRQPFATVLSNRPHRTISISAAGLILPVAAAYTERDGEGIEDIVKQLRMQVSTLFEQIEMHVDNFYQAEKVNPGEPLSGLEQEKLYLVESPHLEDSVAGLLPAAADARPLIKHCVAEIITSRIDYNGRIEPSDSLLPQSVLATYKLMAAASKGSSPSQDLGMWRVQTVTLLGIANIEKSMVGRIRKLAELVTTAFKPWAIACCGMEARSSHLESVFRQAVELGLEAFGTQQRTNWSWTNDDSDRRMVMLPGFLIEVHGGGRVGGDDQDCGEVAKPVFADV